MSPPGAPASASNDALSLLTLLADKDRAAATIKDYETAKSGAEEAMAKASEAMLELSRERKNLAVFEEEIGKRQQAVVVAERELARRRDAAIEETGKVRAEADAWHRGVVAERAEFAGYVEEKERSLNRLQGDLDKRQSRLALDEEALRIGQKKLAEDAAALNTARALVERKLSQFRSIAGA